jgi:hypothetical protein
VASACGPGARLAGILGRPVCREEERGEKREALTGGARELEREGRRHGSGWPMETDWRPMWRRGSADGKRRSADVEAGIGRWEAEIGRCGVSWASAQVELGG